ncbi:transcription initiation factor TFIID subunit 4-like isoform X2 [Adelges cooleyi]|nr:transcription initiation factor TFIID subunit 4-like isoform X2 [Adelges cooleyi]XP_050438049.1 transcription initiation factor TFIID subunit 4-like isoform X2 [Adelges cooleyi]XP_050438050.1 transcription initiation factor TFIID subunit 4-like isoform X2 [Adelges cooleyi]
MSGPGPSKSAIDNATASSTASNVSSIPSISQADFVNPQQQHVTDQPLAYSYPAQPVQFQDTVNVVYSNSSDNRSYIPVDSITNSIINSTGTGDNMAVIMKSTPQKLQSLSPVSTVTLTGQVSNASVATNVITIPKQMALSGITSINSSPTIMPTNVPLLSLNTLRPHTVQDGMNKNVQKVLLPGVIGSRAVTPGLTLQSLQQVQGGHILLKTDSGHYQLLRVASPGQVSGFTSNTGNYKIQNIPPAVSESKVSIAGSHTTPVQATTQSQAQQKIQDTTKEKCRKFLANLLDLSRKESKAVEKSVHVLIQELVDTKVEPEQFCVRLEKLLNASPQPCLVGFLKKSLPFLRQSLINKELVIHGIKTPKINAVTQATVTTKQQVMNTQMVSNVLSSATVQPSLRMMANHPTLTPTRPISSTKQHRIISQRARVQTPFGITSINKKIGSIRIPPPLATSQTGLLPLPLTTVSLPQPKISSRQMLPKATPLKNVAGSHKQIKTTSTTTMHSNKMPIDQPCTPLTPNVLTQPATINKVKITSANETPLASSSKPPSKEKKQFASTYVPEDDFNDVAAMGGVNLAEESYGILESAEFVGTQIRSCKDKTLLPQNSLTAKIKNIAIREGIQEVAPDVPALISHALTERLKGLIERFSTVAEHRTDFNKADARYEMTNNIRGQLQCLDEIERIQRRKQEDKEREVLMRAAKSRSKNDNPELAILKAKAKELQRVEMEELRQRDANFTALNAIGPRKKQKLDPSSSLQNSCPSTSSANRQMVLGQRIKRVTMQDATFVLEQERDISRICRRRRISMNPFF